MASWGDLPPIALNDDSPLPKYQQLARAIEIHIRDLNIRPHTKLPSENELNELLGLSRSTIRKSLEELKMLGCVYCKQGQGTFVTDVFANSTREVLKPEPASPDTVDSSPGTVHPWQDSGMMTGNKKKKGLIGLLVPTMLNEIYPRIVRGVEDVASARGCSVFIGNTYANRDRELTLMQEMIGRNVDGLILEPTHARFDQPGTRTFKLLKSFPLPFVLIDNDIPGLESSQVIIDDYRGGEVATRYLIGQGHRSITYIFKETVLPALDRRDGFLAAMKSAGLHGGESCLCPYTENEEPQNPGYFLTKRLLMQENRPTAIFYFNDELAIHGMRAIHDAGMHIPQDISIIGFDNIPSAAAPDIRLTTMEHPKYFCGRWAADILFDQIDRGTDSLRRRITVHPELVKRETVAPPRR